MQGKRGRPRSEQTQRSILEASYELLLEHGFGAVTVEKIADRAKVSKATIYKWWPNKAAVVMDGYLSAASERLPVPDTGAVYDDVIQHASNLARFLTGREGSILAQLVGEGQFDSGLAEAYRERYFQPRRQEARRLLERGIQRGQLKAGVEADTCIDLIYGPIFYRLLITGARIDGDYVERLVHMAFDGIRT
ncbi:TetR/AcrR family transcriptional regulator [Gorillibacterium sp. sgz5001074]|uniref:TetR/AcrR family transcriptional regulator n=1 Tax=Gorillibacterium sp. sgz5001074 TaxID=3446695 RepID=UPI003F67427B